MANAIGFLRRRRRRFSCTTACFTNIRLSRSYSSSASVCRRVTNRASNCRPPKSFAVCRRNFRRPCVVAMFVTWGVCWWLWEWKGFVPVMGVPIGWFPYECGRCGRWFQNYLPHVCIENQSVILSVAEVYVAFTKGRGLLSLEGKELYTNRVYPFWGNEDLLNNNKTILWEKCNNLTFDINQNKVSCPSLTNSTSMAKETISSYSRECIGYEIIE